MANTLNLGNGDWATKENSLLGYNSENGNYKPLPFDFTRASNGTFVNKSGLIETAANGVPRIDFSDSEDGALLLEPQRSNLMTNSNLFTNWTKQGNITITANQVISPDGLQNASIIDFSSATSASNGLYKFGGTPSASVSRTIYLKGEVGGETLDISDPNQGGGSTITLTTKWQRFEYTGGSAALCGIWLKNSVGNVIHAYGSQIEQGSYATSLINTEGSAVTRVADACNNGGNEQVINSTEGTLYFEGSYPKTTSGSGNKRIAISDGTSSNRVMFAEIGNTGLSALITSQGINSAYITGSLDNLSNFKAAISYKQNDFALWINGLKVATDTSGNVPIGLNEIAFDGGDGTNDFFGKTKDLKVYNTALTDAELAILTTI